MTNHQRRSRRPVIRTTLASTTIAISTMLGAPEPPVVAAPSAPTTCSITPEPDAMPDPVGILGSVMITDEVLAVLHRVDCDGRTIGWRWLTANDILRTL